MNVLHLSCLVCAKTYRPDQVDYVCPNHGDDGILDVVYDYERIGATLDREAIAGDDMWALRPLLPVGEGATLPPLRIGGTPLYQSPRLAQRAGVAEVWIKDEGVQPTGSLKDRASAMAIVKADERKAGVITTASTGNAAAALAGVAASVGRATVIFVPTAAPEAKVAQLLAYGAKVLLVDGSYDEAVELCLRSAEKFDWYNRTTGFNPYMSEGKKTVAHEIARQLDWHMPDAVFVSVGDGCIVGSLWKGFTDLLELGWIGGIPRIIGVQAAGSAFLAEAWESGEDVLTKPPIHPETVADSISAGLPRDRIKAMRAIVNSDGAFVTVTDDEILAAIPTVASQAGVFPEPAAAASWAGVEVARETGVISAGDLVVAISTGTGLKDIPAAMRAVSTAGIRAHHVAPDLDSVATALEEWTG
ncbi:MAG TPA: threonine synthase [Acidimicrobiia bacterium]|nr:threonine synthase [Acidimicrobiia bacterium]